MPREGAAYTQRYYSAERTTISLAEASAQLARAREAQASTRPLSMPLLFIYTTSFYGTSW